MTGEVLSGPLFFEMVRGGAGRLANNREVVNDLNVFPIPDGDTGDNMFMTIDSGAGAVKTGEKYDLNSVSEQIARGMLLGARGNSGVILSRIFAGIAKGFAGVESADVRTLGDALEHGVKEAYGAVSQPVEGTILTVFREAVAYANDRIEENTSLTRYFEDFTGELQRSLMRTPELLSVLKEAGVVDSGGAGLVYIAEGMRSVLNGEAAEGAEHTAPVGEQKQIDFSKFNENSVLEFGYCTEFLLQLTRAKTDVEHFDVDALTDWLCSIGDSVVCFAEGTVIKVHVHTTEPGVVLNHCQEFGEFLTLKIENMTLQHSEAKIENRYEAEMPPLRRARKKFGVAAVANGKGVKETFLSSGVDYVVEGGQSMNPSAEDFLRAFDEINADTIFVFPNNGNVILTAKQAAGLYDKSDVRVIETKDIGQGYAGVSMLDSSLGDADEMAREVEEVIAQVVTGGVSVAVRDTEKDGVKITKGDYLGFVGDTVYTDQKCAFDAALELAQRLDAGKRDVMFLICGADAPAEEARRLYDEMAKLFRRTEIIMIDGGQPIYDYLIVLE